jgi:hypothetical protein
MYMLKMNKYIYIYIGTCVFMYIYIINTISSIVLDE